MNKLSQQDLFMGEMTWRKINYVQKHNNSSIIFFQDNTSTFRQFWPRDRCRCCLVLYRRLPSFVKKTQKLVTEAKNFLQKSGDVVVAFAYTTIVSTLLICTHTTFSSIIIMLWLSDYFRVCEMYSVEIFFKRGCDTCYENVPSELCLENLSVDFTVLVLCK